MTAAPASAEPTSLSTGPAVPIIRNKRPRSLFPWALLVPTLVILGILVGYPLVRLFVMSFQEYGAKQLFGQPARFIGLDNYTSILSDGDFWSVLTRSVALMVVCVVLTLGVGTLVALLMMRLNKGFRLLVSVGMLLAWAMPPLSATIVWGWIFDNQFGIVNYLLGKVTGNDWTGHSWLANPVGFFTVAAIIIVWGAIPFVAFTMYAGLTQVPTEVLEAAQLDGAGPVARFRLIMVPFVRPIFTVLVILSVIWDLRVFTQIYALQGMGGLISETNVLGTYIYQQAFSSSNYGVASAIGVIMVIILMSISSFYVRRTIKEEEL
jgi:N,N'-diacetylchitobiose transport system permease protein